MKKLLLVSCLSLLTACATQNQGPSASAKLVPTKGNNTSGSVSFTQSGNKVLVIAEVYGLKPNAEHGFHIHDKGDCSSGDGMSIVTYDIVVTGELKDEILERVPGESIKINGDHYWNRKDKHHGSMMYRTSLGKRVKYEKRFPGTTSHSQEDWRLWEMMLADGASVSSIAEGLLFYRRHRENFLKYKSENSLNKLVQHQELQVS